MTHERLVRSAGLSPIMAAEIGKIIRQINALARYDYVLETGSLVMQGQARELLQNEGVKKAYQGM